MKYRVKFRCYWYNTGNADNHHYINNVDFETFEEAKAFSKRVDEQYEMSKKQFSIYDPKINEPTEYQKKYCITKQEYDEWSNNFDFIEVENGFIDGKSEIVKYYPEIEVKI